MKIAVASTETLSLSNHFGRSAFFVVFEVENGEIKGKEIKKNNHTPHARGECAGEAHAGGNHGHGHADVISALQGCEAVICGGMGERAAQDLSARGIRPLIVSADCSVDQAVSRYLAGELNTQAPVCCCRH